MPANKAFAEEQSLIGPIALSVLTRCRSRSQLSSASRDFKLQPSGGADPMGAEDTVFVGDLRAVRLLEHEVLRNLPWYLSSNLPVNGEIDDQQGT